MIRRLLLGLNSLKPLLHLGKQNYTDLHLSFGKGGSTGMALSMESGNRNRTGESWHQDAPGRWLSTELSFCVTLGSAYVVPRGCPRELEHLLQEVGAEQGAEEGRANLWATSTACNWIAALAT